MNDLTPSAFDALTDKEALRLLSIRLVAVLVLSDIAELERDPFERRMRINEMQASIQAGRAGIEAIAEGLAQ
jgi:hypothetical protein